MGQGFEALMFAVVLSLIDPVSVEAGGECCREVSQSSEQWADQKHDDFDDLSQGSEVDIARRLGIRRDQHPDRVSCYKACEIVGWVDGRTETGPSPENNGIVVIHELTDTIHDVAQWSLLGRPIDGVADNRSRIREHLEGIVEQALV